MHAQQLGEQPITVDARSTIVRSGGEGNAAWGAGGIPARTSLLPPCPARASPPRSPSVARQSLRNQHSV